MKIIHCADIHLDSKLGKNYDAEKAKNRKNELLYSFVRMIDFAEKNEVSVILIAGDLFDRNDVSASCRNTVFSAVRNHPDILFFYLRGNHDAAASLTDDGILPENLKMFGTDWTGYDMGKVTVTGLEFCEGSSGAIYNSLLLPQGKFNIVMLHGQESESSSKDKTEVIDLKALRNKEIDYLALGHVHAYKKVQLDARAVYCYSGCLEGRGFDEIGEHGFVVLDIDEDNLTYTDEFIPFASRRVCGVEADISDCVNTSEMIEVLKRRFEEEGISEEEIVKGVLIGEPDVETEKDISFIDKYFERQFYLYKTEDRSSFRINHEAYIHDESLKGEFVRCVMESIAVSDEDKASIIRYGIHALMGEDID